MIHRRSCIGAVSSGMLGALHCILADAATPKIHAGRDLPFDMKPMPVQVRPALASASLAPVAIDLSQFRGSWVYLDFWASWCAPCRQSFDWMNRWHQQFAPRGLQVVAVGLDQQRQAMDAFLRSNPSTFWVLWDASGQWARAMQVKAMPTSFLVSPSGQVISEHRGFSSAIAESVERELGAVLSSKGGA